MNTFQIPPIKFVSDGCSGGLSLVWYKLFKTRPPFEECCYNHDIEYHYGSGPNASHWDNFIERLQVDSEFALCMWRNSLVGKLLCIPVWFAVRLGGGSYRNKSYSWGFGWKE